MINKRSLHSASIALIALVASIVATTPPLNRLSGLSLDVLTALSWRTFGARHEKADSPTIVIALDEETADTPPFRGTPAIAWTGEIGRVIAAVVDGGAAVVGIDFVTPTSIEESEIPFDGETIGARMRGFDREYLRSIASAAKDGKIVLGEIQSGEKVLLPSPGQRAAVGQQKNIRSINVYADADDVIRRTPLMITGRGAAAPSMALELAARALRATPQIGKDGEISLLGYRIPSHPPNVVTLNFEGGSNDIPTYSLADLRACLDNGERDFFRKTFSGRVVLIGSTFDLGDLKLTSKRFATGSEPVQAERCIPKSVPVKHQIGDKINGVYIHATAVNNIIRREAVVELATIPNFLISVGGAALGALAGLFGAPLRMIGLYLVLAGAWCAIATVAFFNSFALPLLPPLAAGFIALVGTVGFRLFVADRDKIALRRNFELYLAPALIEKMLNSNSPLALGGETREVTILFLDLVGYSTIAENLNPAELVAVINRYFSAMTDIIERHGGFVDKYVGDAIVAIFGAPVASPSHSADAVRAALACRAALTRLNAPTNQANAPKLSHRAGLNTGRALIGNIGSARRFNYTAIGDSVNIAARLEAANRHFGTAILASETTMALTQDWFVWREIDLIKVKGRIQPVRIFEPLTERGRQTSEQRALATAYAEGLSRWRERNFAAAAAAFAQCADNDRPSALFLARAERLRASPLSEDWEPIYRVD